MAYRIKRGLGQSIPAPVATIPLPAGYIDCGAGLQVKAGTLCPNMVACPGGFQVVQGQPCPDPAAIAQSQTDYNARAARCKTYQTKEYGIDAAVGLAAALLLHGWWKILAVPIALAVELRYPRSPDCDYGF